MDWEGFCLLFYTILCHLKKLFKICVYIASIMKRTWSHKTKQNRKIEWAMPWRPWMPTTVSALFSLIIKPLGVGSCYLAVMPKFALGSEGCWMGGDGQGWSWLTSVRFCVSNESGPPAASGPLGRKSQELSGILISLPQAPVSTGAPTVHPLRRQIAKRKTSLSAWSTHPRQ